MRVVELVVYSAVGLAFLVVVVGAAMAVTGPGL